MAALITLKTAVLAPMPIASARRATIVNDGVFNKLLMVYLTSRRIVSIGCLQRQLRSISQVYFNVTLPEGECQSSASAVYRPATVCSYALSKPVMAPQMAQQASSRVGTFADRGPPPCSPNLPCRSPPA